ncbi:RCC1 domain-containing protein [Silvanigrella aquatica]|uniref:Chromosome condensation regulator RCC1 n=1 Tax=Silvanigrella aquatica TaxID=1915309 RepID=A0A1L4D0Y6_9BACT|nr:hypothetical protein [Silvanigrella aquatica]APJ03873.1 hypothetical protein AXG55_08115 [Silvanigrella aquatica]
MKKSNFIWLFFLIPIYYFHSCAPSINLQDPPMTLVQSLSSDGSLKDLAKSALAAGKVAQYTTHGGKNGLISLGDANGCVVMTKGWLKCWGENFNGQLGLGYISPSTEGITNPTWAKAVNPKEDENDIIASVVMGRSSTCAQYASGYKCWGRQEHGVLGNRKTVENALEPEHVINTEKLVLKAVQLNDGFSCVLDTTEKITCWGENHVGQLGNRNKDKSITGSEVFLEGVAATELVSHNADSCVILSTGEVKCWGRNFSNSFPYSPVSITTAHPVKFLGGGTCYSPALICAVLQDTTVQCFGNSLNLLGEFGNGTFDRPSSITTGESVKKAEGGGILNGISMIGSGGAKSLSDKATKKTEVSFACAVGDHNTSVYCWGANGDGNLGNSTHNDSNVAVKVHESWNQNLDHNLIIIDLAVSDARACVLLKNEDVWCWGGGLHNKGELGNGKLDGTSNVPIKILNRNDE